jgi:hypothetical protein
MIMDRFQWHLRRLLAATLGSSAIAVKAAMAVAASDGDVARVGWVERSDTHRTSHHVPACPLRSYAGYGSWLTLKKKRQNTRR